MKVMWWNMFKGERRVCIAWCKSNNQVEFRWSTSRRACEFIFNLHLFYLCIRLKEDTWEIDHALRWCYPKSHASDISRMFLSKTLTKASLTREFLRGGFCQSFWKGTSQICLSHRTWDSTISSHWICFSLCEIGIFLWL